MTTAARLPTPPRSNLAGLLERTPVRRIMRSGVVAVAGNASLLQVADAMAAHGVHAVLVLDPRSPSPAGWVTGAALRDRLLEYSPFEAAAALIDERVWPAVQEEYGRLRATPGALGAALAAVGLGSLLVRRQLERARPPRLLGIVKPRGLRRRRGWRDRLARLRGGRGP